MRSAAPLRRVLDIDAGAGFADARVLLGRQILPLERVDRSPRPGCHPPVPALPSTFDIESAPQAREPGLGYLDSVDDSIIVLEHLIAVDGILAGSR